MTEETLNKGNEISLKLRRINRVIYDDKANDKVVRRTDLLLDDLISVISLIEEDFCDLLHQKKLELEEEFTNLK